MKQWVAAAAGVLLAAGVWLGVATAGTNGRLHHPPTTGDWHDCPRQLPQPDVLPAPSPPLCAAVVDPAGPPLPATDGPGTVPASGH